MSKKAPTKIGKILNEIAFSFVPLILVIIGTLSFIPALVHAPLINTTLTTDLSKENLEMNIQFNEIDILQKVNEIERFVNTTQESFNSIFDYTMRVFVENKTSQRTTYYYGDLTPNMQPSTRYNTSVDFTRTNVRVFPSMDRSTWTKEINHTIAVTANLDLLYPAMFTLVSSAISIQVGTPNGVLRTFPNYKYNISQDFRTQTWYTQALLSNQTVISNVTVDDQLQELKMSMSKQIVINNQIQGVLALHFDLDYLQKILFSERSSSENYNFIYDETGKVIAHSIVNLETFKWNSTFFNQENITVLYPDAVGYIDYIYPLETKEVHRTFNETQTIVLIVLKPLKLNGLYLATFNIYFEGEVKGGYKLQDLLLIPTLVITFLTLVSLFIFRRYGFLKGLSLDDVLQRFETRSTPLETLKETGKKALQGGSLKIRTTISKETSFLDKITGINQLSANAIKNGLNEVVEETMDKVEEKMDETLDKKIFNPIANLEKQLASLREKSVNVQESIQKIKNKAVNIDQIIRGDFQQLQGLNKAEIIGAMLINSQEIDIYTLAKIVNRDPDTLELWLKTLENTGLSISNGVISIDKTAVTKNLETIMESFQKTDFEEFTNMIPIYYRAENLDKNLVNEFLNNPNTKDKLPDNVKNQPLALLAAVLLHSQTIPLPTIAELLQSDKEIIAELFKKLPNEYGIAVHDENLQIDQEKLQKRLIPLLILINKSYNPEQ